MLENKTSLRLLYTINSSPQYILARSHTTVPVTLVPPEGVNGDNAQPVYGSVLLKTCLNTICRSSPELIQDHSRDFSLYVLDPLESNSAPAPVRISNSNKEPSSTKPSSSLEQPRGVAVGLGLMSWALSSEDSDPMTVVGTIVKQGTGQEALEVIFALRETVAMKQPTWTASSTSVRHANVKEDTHKYDPSRQYSSQPVASSSRLQVSSTPSSAEAHSYTADTTRETLASIHMRTKAKTKPPKKTLRHSAIPVTESDKLMNAETYIGPLKKKGRPKNVEAGLLAPQSVAPPSVSVAQEVIVIDESDSDSAPAPAVKNRQVKSDDIRSPTSRNTNKKNRRTKQPTTAPFSTDPLIRRATQTNETPALLEPKVESHELNILDVIAYLSTTSSSEPNGQNATILAALSLIDSPESLASGNPSNTGLVAALQQLLSLYSKSKNPEPGPPQKPPTSPSQNDGIVIDKENINPSKVQKKSEKDGHTCKISISSSTPSSGLHSPEQTSRTERHIQGLKPSARSNDNPLSKQPISKAGSDRGVRKRTLSDFMDEKESCKSRGKGKERARVERQDGHRHPHLQRAQKSALNDSLRHYPRFIASNQPRVEQPSSYYRTGMEPWSSPPRPCVTLHDQGGETLGGINIFRKPQSPKISASSPVRSVQAQRDARKKYVVPEWARTSTATQPRLSEDAQRALEEADQNRKRERSLARKRLSMQNKSGTKDTSVSTLNPKKPQSEENHTSFQEPRPPPGPIAATSSGPLFAAVNTAFPIFASTRSSSPPPNPPSIPKTPKTPIRNRQPIRATPGRECDSLFTPVMRSGSLFGSANSHSSRTALLPTFTSPLGNRKKAKIGPEDSILRLKGTVLADAWSTTQSAESKTQEPEQPGEDPSVALKQELENAFDDLDCPPSSLPIASSDIDVDDPNPQAFHLDPMDADDETETRVVKPYWPGLPPSSPPPPSSPMMLPEAPDFEFQTDDEMEDLELPVATDSETDPDVTAFDTDISSPSESPAYCNDQNETPSATDDFSAYFPQQEDSPDAQDNRTLTVDVFEQFMNFNNESDGLQGYEGGIANSDLFQNGLDDIDFTEFWQTFKPLIDDNVQAYRGANVDNGSEREKDVTIGSFEDIDPTKLADDMQSLLSGCLM